MNPLYQQLTGGGMPQNMSVQSPIFRNPIQIMAQISQAMQNPAAFVKSRIPGLPNEIANDPNRILQYMQQNMGVTNEQIQQAANAIPRF